MVGLSHYSQISLNQNFVSQVVNNDTTGGLQSLYLQGLAGIQTTVQIPDLSNWVNEERYVINEARLIIPIKETFEDLSPPDKLVLFIQQV